MNKTGIGTRVLNFIVDTIFISLISFGVYKLWQFYAFYYGIIYFPYYMFFWAVLFLYYFIFEAISARTPGKWISFSKVVQTNGKKPNILQVFIRSLIRLTIIDCFFYPFLEKTLHDYLSKTDVVEK